MTAFSAAIDAIFADPNMAADATYLPITGGAAVAVRLISRRPDEAVEYGGSTLVTPTALYDVRTSDVAELRKGDCFDIDGVRYEVQAKPRRDRERLTWTFGVIEVGAA